MHPPIALASDHGGYLLKAHLLPWLTAQGWPVIDLGATSADQSVDYPAYGQKLAEYVVAGQARFGIAICGSGIGISMAANRLAGARAALCTDMTMARLARAHNDANILCLGARLIGATLAEDIVGMFLATEFAGGRHHARVTQLG